MNKSKYNATFISTVLTLFLFWMLITWRLHWQHLLVGFICALVIAAFNADLLLHKEERPLFLVSTAGRWVSYFWSLIIAIFKSNWDVAKIVLRPNMDISPCFVRFRTKIKKPLNRVILGNSITLTPGTLTVELEDDFYIVHCITRANAEDVASWYMTDRLVAIEEAELNA